jgi:hypothetical protein
MALGKDLSGRTLFPTLDQNDFLQKILRNLVQRWPQVPQPKGGLGGEVSRVVLDRGDPEQAGWTFVVAQTDPRSQEYIEALRELAEVRKMHDPSSPLIFDAAPEGWSDWINDELLGLPTDGKPVPHFILLVGGPQYIPFHFQSVLDSFAQVGRLDFDDIRELKSYIRKLINLERAAEPAGQRAAVIFATDDGPNDPTHYSSRYMAMPLADHCQGKHGLPTSQLIGLEATKRNLLESVQKNNPVILYTATHGLGLGSQSSVQDRQRYNGSICCDTTNLNGTDALFSADDVPSTPFLEGGVFFQFACHGYGTPDRSDFTHWLGDPQDCADSTCIDPFVAALPKKLLAHPRGPIAYIGHVDLAFLHGFTDPHDLISIGRWSKRMSPFVAALDSILTTQPSGLAMEDINKRYNLANAVITGVYNRIRGTSLSWTPEQEENFVDQWIYRTDAQNYILLGDPAARVRVPV